MSDAARLTRFQISQFTHMLRKTAEENDLFIKSKLILTLGAMLLAGVAALVCTAAVIIVLVLPAVALLSPLLLVLSVLSLLHHKATRLWRRRSQSGNINDQNSSVVAEVGAWSVMSNRYKSRTSLNA